MGGGWNKDNITNEVMGFKKANVITNSTSAPPRLVPRHCSLSYVTNDNCPPPGLHYTTLQRCPALHYVTALHCTTLHCLKSNMLSY